MKDRVVWIGKASVDLSSLQAVCAWNVVGFPDTASYLQDASDRDVLSVVSAETPRWASAVAELCRELWRRRLPPGVVVALMNPSLEELEQAWRTGALEVVRLPCTAGSLQRLLREAAARWRPIGQWLRSSDGWSRRELELSPREWLLGHLLARGMSIKRIAAQWDVSVHTTRHQRRRLFEKLGVDSEAELAHHWGHARMLEQLEAYFCRAED
ncbi:MAG: hypothetical protein KatS3mg109_1116 [Pirellulaceae bacterium]|nr:MAG: hypothetical protein KatS3mg109_1116 [Pirellulaceae bacterium]